MAGVSATDSKGEAKTIEEERTFRPGSVWSVEFFRVKPGRGMEYNRQLSQTWKKLLDEQRKEGIVLSYKIFVNSPYDREDFTHMLMVEFPNFGVFDQQEKIDATLKRVHGSLANLQEIARTRVELREALGSRLVREVHFK